MAITPTDFDKIWSTNASTPEYTFSDADYLEGWDFVGNLPPTRAQWNAIQKRTDEKMKYVFDNFGAPLVASTVAEMTLTNRVYVYTGSEAGYTAGHWYYYDTGTSAWVDGGVYNAMLVQTDKTLSISDEPADAKVTGDFISALNKNIQSLHAVAISGDLNNKTSSTTYGLSVEVDGCVIKLNGTVSGSTSSTRLFSLQETPPKGYSTATNFYNGCTISNTFLAGHKYRLHAMLVGGTFTSSGNTYGPGYAFIGTNTLGIGGYADGHNAVPIMSGDGVEITYETDTTVGALFFRSTGTKVFNNAVIVAYIEDVTLTSKLNTTDKTLSIDGLPADAGAVGEIKDMLIETVNVPTNFVIGGINTRGNITTDTDRVRTGMYARKNYGKNLKISCDSGVQFDIGYYNGSTINSTNFGEFTGWLSAETNISDEYPYFAVIGRTSPQTTIVDPTVLDGKIHITSIQKVADTDNELAGKTVAILGDSISTNGNYSSANPYGNVPEIVVTEDDIGVELSAYATYYDIGTTIGGHTITADDVGTEITFTPVVGDEGKMVGVPKNNNATSVTVWWEVLRDKLGIEPIPVAWSGSSITSHEANTDILKTSYAWHPAQIRKCGIRIDGSMERIAPDIIVIMRCGNDFSHSPYTRLTPNYFDQYPCTIPATDYDSENNTYGFIEGLCITIQKLKEAYPKAQIFLATQNFIKRVVYSSFPTRNTINTLPQYNKAIRDTANYFGLPLIEFDKDGLDFWSANNEYYQDGTAYTHPTTKGHAVMAQRAEKDLINGYVDINI